MLDQKLMKFGMVVQVETTMEKNQVNSYWERIYRQKKRYTLP